MMLGPLMIDVAGTVLKEEERERLCHPAVGGVILFSRNFESPVQLSALVSAIRLLREPQLLIAVDQEGGRVQRFREGFTTLPAMRQLGRQHDTDADAARHLAHACGWLMAAELLAVGVDFSFAPCVDLDSGLSAVIGHRALHRDPQVVAGLAVAHVQGMHRAGMAAVAKHFPGHGTVVEDSHHELPIDRRGLAEISEDMLPYRRLMQHGLEAILAAHVRYPEVDHRMASVSPVWLREKLRAELGFEGAVFTDDLSMGGAAAAGGLAERVGQSLDAGADMALICNDPEGAAQLLDAHDFRPDPAAQARLVAMRGDVARYQGLPALRVHRDWQWATRQLSLLKQDTDQNA